MKKLLFAALLLFVSNANSALETTTPIILDHLTVTNLDSPLPSSSVSYTQSGTGGATSSIQTRESNVVFVTDFSGVDKTGVSDSTTGIQSAITYVETYGGTLYFPCGSYLANNGLSITSTIRIQGESKLCTTIAWTSLTLNVVTIDTPSSVTIKGFVWQGPVNGSFDPTSTAGADIVITNTASSATTSVNSNSEISDNIFYYGYIAVNSKRGTYLKLANNFFQAQKQDCVRLDNEVNADGGDNTLNLNTFSGYAGTTRTQNLVEHVSGGGLRIVNNKIIGGEYGYRMNFTAVPTSTSTTILVIADNSIENQNTGSLLFTYVSGSANYYNTTITGNVFGNCGNCIQANGSTAFLQGFVVSGNTFRSESTTLINVNHLAGFNLSGNDFFSLGGIGTGVTIGSSVTSGGYCNNTFSNITTGISNSSVSNVLACAGGTQFNTGFNVGIPSTSGSPTEKWYISGHANPDLTTSVTNGTGGDDGALNITGAGANLGRQSGAAASTYDLSFFASGHASPDADFYINGGSSTGYNGDVTLEAKDFEFANMIDSNTVTTCGGKPTLTSGWGTGATVDGSSCAFQITVGTSPSTTGVLTFPAMQNVNSFTRTGWNCIASDMTTRLNIWQTATNGTTTATLGGFNSSFSATAPTASDKIMVQCHGF